MIQKSRPVRLLGFLFIGLCILLSERWIMRAQPKQSPNFTGGTVTPVEENSQGSFAHLHFSPGARTKWHYHEHGQIILVEEGVGRTQVKGGPVMELHAGETTYAQPGAVHWHGAAPEQGGTQFNVSRGATTWLDEVPQNEYTAPPKR
jgi:quercetin dioxygenase-like cupin family protein